MTMADDATDDALLPAAGGDNNGGLGNLLIEDEMKESYLTYAMSVLVDRALPDIRDGLKPVHRRILYSMRDLNLSAGQRYQKSARIVGHCIGNYHPHGDSAVYDAMVRMAQTFSLRYPLVDGQGNFGSVDGDSAAAYRYTEARMDRLAGEMLEDIQYDTVDTRPTFDEQNQEPIVLPSKLPNLLVNGSSGIAVGMATNIPPHNLTEICLAARHLIENPAATVDDLMQFVRAPDFPTGGLICGTGGIRSAYETGRGRLLMRARVHTEEVRGHQCLVVTEIPYGRNLKSVIESIARAVDTDGQVKGIGGMHGGTVKEGIRLVLELKRGEDPDVVLNQLWKHTSLQATFSFNMIALDGGRPRTVGLRRMLSAWIAHRRDVIIRRTRFLLARDEARLHIVQGLLKAIDIIDEIIALIRASESVDQARRELIDRFEFSERQAQAILDMQLRRLTGLERDKLMAERDELEARIADYRDILAREERQYRIITDDLDMLVEKYGDERRTQITHDVGDLNMEDLIEDTPCVITITNSGYIKRLPVDTYRTQRRGGRGVTGGKLKGDDDFVSVVIRASNHQYLLFFTTAGRVHWRKAYVIPQGSRTSRGKALANVLELQEGEHISATIPMHEFPDDQYLFMATAQGIVKKCPLSAFSRPRNAGIIALSLAENDHLVGTVITSGDDVVMLASDDGQACRFHESDVRPTGRTSAGVRGIRLAADAQVVSLVRCDAGVAVLSICARGYGKRTPCDEYRKTARGGKGVININTGPRNGPVVASLPVRDGDEIILMSRSGMVVRTKVDDIRSTGRNAAGVTVINLSDDDAVVGVAYSAAEDDPAEDEDATQAVDPEATGPEDDVPPSEDSTSEE
ncbi:MAG: DNA gyrase subunit A [Planctomycetota bacterium]|nr:MAG: DNA gyrase subunit A [Planctomycetota bacterium]